MLLAVDIGNTNITIGVFNQKDLLFTSRLISAADITIAEYQKTLENICEDLEIQEIIISSVSDKLTEPIKQACQKAFGVQAMVLDSGLETGMKILTVEREKVGADRIANAFAARKYGLPAIVVDVGTAVTFDIVSKNGDFIGGIIMPGLNMQLESLYEKTSKLPEIEVKDSPMAIGNTTETCILSGVIRGVACAIDGLLEQCEEELGEKAVTVLTGGQSEIISQYMTRKIDFVNSNHTLEGLRDIYYQCKNVVCK